MRPIVQLLLLAVLFAVVVLVAGCAGEQAQAEAGNDDATAVRQWYQSELRLLDSAVIKLQAAAAEQPAIVGNVQSAFRGARMAYKRVEFLAEFCNPVTAKNINGPALDRMEEDNPDRVFPPQGFQVIEEMIFPTVDTSVVADLREELTVLRANIRRLQHFAEANRITDAQIFEAMRLQVVRVITVGISGFDSPVALGSLPEAAESLRGIHQVLQLYAPLLQQKAPHSLNKLEELFGGAVAQLEGNITFDDFDRLGFIVGYANPISATITDVRDSLGISPAITRSAYRFTARTVFDVDAFDPMFFAPAQTARHTNAQVELGKTLFFDPVLSGNGKRSCGSCHQPELAFSDGAAKSVAFDLKGHAARNAPTVINAGLQPAQFFDVRTIYLEDQAADVVGNKTEMHGSLEDAVQLLRRSPGYRQMFDAAFAINGSNGSSEDSVITSINLRTAIAAFIRSLTSLNAPFDRYMRGDVAALNPEEKDGFNLFMGKAKCGTCHFMPLFNGTVPPRFSEIESEVLGIPKQYPDDKLTLDTDVGRFGSNRLKIHVNSFKTSTVRNAALTAPYMHNGGIATLEQVVDFYNRGGGAGLGLDVPNQTLPTDSLNLTPAEQRAIIAFMRALTDTSSLPKRPTQLPRINDAGAFAERVVGGTY